MHRLTCDAVELAVGDFINGRVLDNTLQTIDKAVANLHFLQVVWQNACNFERHGAN